MRVWVAKDAGQPLELADLALACATRQEALEMVLDVGGSEVVEVEIREVPPGT